MLLSRSVSPELEIKDTTESNISASYLDLLLSIGRDGQLHTSLYDDFNFHITNFPFLRSNIPSSPAYAVFISQLIRYARASSSYECFILRAVRLSNKLLGQGYVKERLRSSLRKFYGRYGDLIKQYEVPLSRMLQDILDDDHLQLHPLLISHYTNFWPYYWTWPYPSGHLVPSPILGLANAPICWDLIPLTCHVFTRLFTSNTPWYFLDFAYNRIWLFT